MGSLVAGGERVQDCKLVRSFALPNLQSCQGGKVPPSGLPPFPKQVDMI
ncbi:MAG: hypothetical protein LBQ24_05950 [Candidatus Peribacteria bacterium]|nr:hypothetical protein [Candidatus Peribacteria bacterium]